MFCLITPFLLISECADLFVFSYYSAEGAWSCLKCRFLNIHIYTHKLNNILCLLYAEFNEEQGPHLSRNEE